MAEVRNDIPAGTETRTAGPPIAPAEAPTLAPAGAPPSADERPGVPGYELHEELGRGGMGVVYKARQLSLNRFVALKMVLAGPFAGADQLARFRVEAESVARLQHPSIVQIHEIGSHAGHSYLALEYVPGGTLAQHCAGKPLAPSEAARLVETLARAVHYAHQRGIIHRDLKPGNVLLTEDGQPKIADFGLAKMLDSGSGSATPRPQTQSGAILGTPAYMAPEQTGGKRGTVGPAADIYALGAILYELLTGRPPFQADTPVDVILKVATEEPPRPRQVEPAVPRDLEAVCLKSLQKNPAARYASAAELADDLLRFLKGEPTVARPATRGARFRAGAWRRRWWLAGCGTAACLLLLSSCGFVYFLMTGGPVTTRRESPSPPPLRTEQAHVATTAREQPPVDINEVHASGASDNNLKEIGLAMHEYQRAFGQLPQAAITDKAGKPLLSWRVALLPHMISDGGRRTLYGQFKLDEPWDSDHNKKLLDRMPSVYAPPLKPAGWKPNTTYYQVFTGEQTLFPPGKKMRLSDIKDGPENTILIVEAYEAVPWTKPADLLYDPTGPLPQLGGIFGDGFRVAMADGSVGHFLPKNIDPATLRALITPAGGEKVTLP
jgi:hypothetical protein